MYRRISATQSDFFSFCDIQASKIIAMGNLLSTFVHMSRTIFYKCEVTHNNHLDHFLFEEEKFIFLSDPDAKIVTIEEDYEYNL